jgi:ribonuclease HII
MPAATRSCPNLARLDDDRRRRHGVVLVGGVDEAGRGPLAGPVVAACVVLAPGARLSGVDDSKKLSPAARQALVPGILEKAAAWGVGLATAAEIDRLNVLRATHLAARRALAMLAVAPDYLITDYLKLEGAPCPVEPLAKADAQSQAVAAASILAKVARDRIMTLLDEEFPTYGFAGHKGYGTAAHLAALRAHGPSMQHRLTFGGVLPEPLFGQEEPPRLAPARAPDRVERLIQADPPDPPAYWRGLLSAASV